MTGTSLFDWSFRYNIATFNHIPILEVLKLPPLPAAGDDECLDLGWERLVGNDLDWETDIGLVGVAGGGDEAKYSTASAPDSKSSRYTCVIKHELC